MSNSNSTDKPKMGPPRLTLVPKEELPTEVHASLGDGGAVAAAAGGIAGAAVDAVSGEHGERDVAAEGSSGGVDALASQDRLQKLRLIEALLFAAPQPLGEDEFAAGLIASEEIGGLIAELAKVYAGRGVNLVRVAGKWAFRTADDLSFLLQRFAHEQRRLSKAALETLSIIAYHQPVTRAEIEDVRGVTTSAGTIDILLETGWIRPRGRRRAPGRPVTYGTTETFLTHFGLDSVKDLPGLAELRGAGLLDGNLPPGFTVPEPSDVAALMPDELPLENDAEDEAQGALAFEDEADADGEPLDGEGGHGELRQSGDENG